MQIEIQCDFRFRSQLMNLSGGGSSFSHSIPPSGSSSSASSSSTSHPYISSKKNSNNQTSPTFSSHDLREFTNVLQELNQQFKRNVQVLTEIKDCIFRVCEKQEARPVDDNSGVHKLERVRYPHSIVLHLSV